MTATHPRETRLEDLDLVGVAEIAARLQVKPQTVSMWKIRGLLPAPFVALRMGDVWSWPTIASWAARTGRL